MNWSWIRQLLGLKTIWISANIVFTTFLTVQLANVLEGYIKPQTTRTWDEDVRFEDMEFPLVIKICVMTIMVMTIMVMFVLMTMMTMATIIIITMTTMTTTMSMATMITT